MTPYPEYKATNLPWLPQIPTHWALVKIRELFTERNQKVSDKEYAPLSVSKGGVIPQISTVAKTDNGDNRKLVKVGDFVINSRSDRKGSSGISAYDGSVSLINLVLKPRNDYNRGYLHYLLKSIPFIEEYYKNGRGIVADLWTTRYSEMKTISIPTPTAAEQEQIVRYLDSMTAKINKLIRAKKKQIALLQEQKQAIINQAVTKGLNPNTEMKDSGIDWLGQIPAHWDIKPLKRVCKVNASVSHLLREFSDDSLVTFLPMEAISVDGKIDCSQKQPLKNVKSGFSSFAVNDVVVAKITPCFENGKGACLDALDTAIGYGTTELIVLRGFKNEINQQFLYQVTKITSFRKNGAEVMTGSAGQKRVPANFIANFTCGIPPLEEQNAIVQYLAKQNALFEKTLNGIKKEIEVILEYKNSLIASVVTGQVDVRNIQVEEFDPADLISEPDDALAEDDDQLQEESEE